MEELASPLDLLHGDGNADGDLQIIRDVLSVNHVPVVASLHWDKLQSILLSLCDRIALQALRLEKAEEQGKTFLVFKDELDHLCKNAVKEMKDAKESELEQQQNWSKTIEERLQSLQQGVDANSSGLKQLGDSVAELQILDTTMQSFASRFDAFEETTKNSLEAFQAPQPISLEMLNEKLEVLVVDFEEQNEKLHTLEEKNEQLKLMLEQTSKSHASDVDSLQQYCKNLRSDFEMKFLVDVPTTTEDELSASASSKLEVAVAELQNRVQKKADMDDIERISISSQNTKETIEKLESNMVELQSQLKRLSAGSRRASRVSFSTGFVPLDNQVSVTEVKATTVDQLSPELVEELTKDVKLAIEDHNKGFAKVQKEFGLLGKSILIMSGHNNENFESARNVDLSDKITKILGDPKDIVPHLFSDLSYQSESNQKAARNSISKDVGDFLDTKDSRPGTDVIPKVSSEVPFARDDNIKNHAHVPTVAQMDDITVVQEIGEALKMNKFEPKEGIKTISRLSQDLSNITSRVHELDATVPTLKDGLISKADKCELQKLALYVKEQLERPENVLFTGKPLYGFKCMSCDHNVEKLNPRPGEHIPTNRMPPQILPMLSAERIFAFDRRSFNDGNVFPMQSTGQQNKTRSSTFSNMASGFNMEPQRSAGILKDQRSKGSRRSSPVKKTSPRKSPM